MKYGILSVALLTVCISSALASAQTKVVVVPLNGKKAVGDAVAADVLEGKIFSNKEEVGIPGSMVNNGAITVTPGLSDQVVPEGYHNGSGMLQGDADLTSGNIRSGVTVFGVGGDPNVVETTSGDAAAGDLLSGKKAWVDGAEVTGTIVTQTLSPTSTALSAGYYHATTLNTIDADLISGNIRSGVTVFGVGGDANVVDTASGDAAAGDLLSGKKAWVDGAEVTGTMATQTLSPASTTVSAGYYGATDLTTVDADLVAANIVYGVTIFGVTGTRVPPSMMVVSAGQVWMDSNLGASQVATSLTDTEAYGDLYQWGRLADGHQSRTSPTTSTLSSSDVPGHGSFILALNSPGDWRSPQNANLWQGVAGVNNPCPAGFRLPTDVELDTERLSWSSSDYNGAFASPLKLVPAGSRYYVDGTLSVAGSYGVYWSSTVVGSGSRYLFFHDGGAGMFGDLRAFGFSVRCLRD